MYKKRDQFYNSSNVIFDGKSPLCKSCIKKMVDAEDIETVYKVLKLLDAPFLYDEWEGAVKKGGYIFGHYMRRINSLPNHSGKTWQDSIFQEDEDDSSQDTYSTNIEDEDFKVTKELLDKWGYGYETEEYLQFERKYQLLKNHYPERTAMHTEALLTYIRYRVKEELATAKGNAKAAKDWGTLAKDAATAAKINPSQLSKADLSDGLDSFSQLVRSVEQAVDVIEILPKFKERPQDKGDFTLWCYVNYVRDLKGLPLAEYEEIYKFYEDRKREYEMNSNKDEKNGIL